MTDLRVGQGGMIALGGVIPGQDVSQGGLIALGSVIPGTHVSQAGAIVLAGAAPCATQRCQLWTLTRRDGTVYRFTSLDIDLDWGGHTYSACSSLNVSAIEQSSDVNAVGNGELDGIIDSDAISDADLYAGLFDDAYLEVWRVDYGDPVGTQRRLAAGWTGQVSQGEQGFKTEVLGPGARLLQKPLLRTVTPGCGWRFGEAATGCPVDAEALKTGAEIVAASSRSQLVTDAADPLESAQWNRGKVRWTSGPNAGVECEVMTVDFVTGVIVLWQPAPFKPAIGDAFDLLPGCDLAFATCKGVYGVGVDFGGFKDVPGQDALIQTPIPKS